MASYATTGCDTRICIRMVAALHFSAEVAVQVAGLSKPEIHSLFEQLRSNAHLEVIGAETSIIEHRLLRSKSALHAALSRLHLMVCNRRSSLSGPSSIAPASAAAEDVLAEPTAQVAMKVYATRRLLGTHTVLILLTVKQTATLRASEKDHRKFYVEFGTQTWHMKAETM